MEGLNLVDLLASGLEFEWAFFAYLAIWWLWHSDSDCSSFLSPLPFSSLQVAIAKLIVAVTISLAGFHLASSSSFGSPTILPKNKKDVPNVVQPIGGFFL